MMKGLVIYLGDQLHASGVDDERFGDIFGRSAPSQHRSVCRSGFMILTPELLQEQSAEVRCCRD
jgi:hypothetical protein